MLRSLVIESLSGIEFSQEVPDRVVDVVTKLVQAQVTHVVSSFIEDDIETSSRRHEDVLPKELTVRDASASILAGRSRVRKK